MLMILSPAKTLDFESPLPTRRRSTPAFSKQSAEVTEDHFAKALQNALQHPAVLPRTGPQADLPAHEKPPVLQGVAAGCEVVQSGRVKDRGLEPGAFPRGNEPDPPHVAQRRWRADPVLPRKLHDTGNEVDAD